MTLETAAGAMLAGSGEGDGGAASGIGLAVDGGGGAATDACARTLLSLVRAFSEPPQSVSPIVNSATTNSPKPAPSKSGGMPRLGGCQAPLMSLRLSAPMTIAIGAWALPPGGYGVPGRYGAPGCPTTCWVRAKLAGPLSSRIVASAGVA